MRINPQARVMTSLRVVMNDVVCGGKTDCIQIHSHAYIIFNGMTSWRDGRNINTESYHFMTEKMDGAYWRSVFICCTHLFFLTCVDALCTNAMPIASIGSLLTL